MELNDAQRAFLEMNHSVAMITVGRDGVPKAVRAGINLVDGKLWSSGTEGRVRTRRLRRDPRCVLFVFDQGFGWLTLEADVRIIEGPEAHQMNLRLFRLAQNKPEGKLTWFGGEYDDEGFLRVMAEEKRVIYEFDITHAYGM